MNQSARHLIVFDFDGVLFNSIHESFLTAVNTYISMEPRHSLPIQKTLSLDEVMRFEEGHPEFYDLFSRLVPLGNEARDYYVIFRIIDQSAAIGKLDQDQFDKFKRTLSPEVLEDFSIRFFRYRQDFQENHAESWLKLIQPFAGMREALLSLADRFAMAVASAKDGKSISMLLKAYGLDFFPDERILDKETGRSKRDHLQRLREPGFVLENMYFVDDKVQHLLSVQDMHVHPFLARWGFNTEREHQIAFANNIPVITIDDLKNITDLGK